MITKTPSEWNFADDLAQLSTDDQDRIQRLWQAYFDRLVRLADRKLPPGLRRECDGEDIALSALNSFVKGARRGRFPDLRDPNDVWSLLVVIANRKLSYRIRAAKRLKRGGGQVRGESVFGNRNSISETEQAVGLESFFREQPTVDEVVQLTETCDRLLGQLDDDYRQVVQFKMQGFTHEEISQRMGLSVRTIHRRLDLVRKLWCEMESQDEAVV